MSATRRLVVATPATGRPRLKKKPVKAAPSLPVVAAIGAASASVGAAVTMAASRFVGFGRFIKGPLVVDGEQVGPTDAGASCPIAVSSGFAAAKSALFPKCEPKPGATRAFLLGRVSGSKPHVQLEAETGIPADTLRKVLLAGGSELSGPHVMRLFAVYGPAFARAVLDPMPAWAVEPEAQAQT
jgi:hypothetical protein